MKLIDACEMIKKADFLRNKDGSAPSAKEIFEYSPTGETFRISEWLQHALHVLYDRGDNNIIQVWVHVCIKDHGVITTFKTIPNSVCSVCSETLDEKSLIVAYACSDEV